MTSLVAVTPRVVKHRFHIMSTRPISSCINSLLKKFKHHSQKDTCFEIKNICALHGGIQDLCSGHVFLLVSTHDGGATANEIQNPTNPCKMQQTTTKTTHTQHQQNNNHVDTTQLNHLNMCVFTTYRMMRFN
jgi:hypothetical protein